jgi:hypothetical protein
VSLSPENNSFLNVRNRFFFNQEKSLRQYEKICETSYWPKNPQKRAGSLQVTGANWSANSPLPPPLVVGHAYICKVAVGQNISAVIYGS